MSDSLSSSHRDRPGLWSWLFLVGFVGFLQGIGLGNHGLFEPDEGRYANMAMEWTEFGEHHWAVPVLSDVGHFDKPPLIYWLTGSSLLLFGKSELAARLPSALGAMLTLTGIGLLAARRGG
ncbi:MAG: glycosyltransferase family 39 protein, partial [Verrucomicrobiae bacterium]|nr:glycosyltransferase family 39 protein [Verrucomicrobiae bacterium]